MKDPARRRHPLPHRHRVSAGQTASGTLAAFNGHTGSIWAHWQRLGTLAAFDGQLGTLAAFEGHTGSI